MTSTVAMSLGPFTILYGTRLISSGTSTMRRPMNRLMEKTVFCGLVTAWRFATVPTRRSPSLVKPTTEGVTRPPSALGMTTGSPPSITATTEFVVPRSIPMIFSAIVTSLVFQGDPRSRDIRPRGSRRRGRSCVYFAQPRSCPALLASKGPRLCASLAGELRAPTRPSRRFGGCAPPRQVRSTSADLGHDDVFPLHDDNPTLRRPVVTYVIVALNLAAWLLIQDAG